MRIALDTNRYVDLMKRDPDAVRIVEDANEVAVPFAVLAELKSGFLAGTRTAANERLLNAFLSRPGVRVLYPDPNTVETYAVLIVQIRHAGRMMPHNDIWIAALCIQHGLTLYTRDQHFNPLSQLSRI